MLHVEDAIELIDLQLCAPDHWQGAVVNVGGGSERAVSLRELTALCQDVTGGETTVEASESDRPGDVPLFITDSRRLFARTDWRPQRDVRTVLEDIDAWIVANADRLESVLR